MIITGEKESDLEWTIRQLETTGEVSRNDSIKIYCYRLAARIDDLKNMGWKIKGERRKTEFGRDYVYKLLQRPEPEQLKLI